MVIAADRKLGTWMTTALVVGGMIGAGIFMLPASLAPYGPNVPLGWLVSGLGAICLAYAFGRLAIAGGGGGIQAYVESAFGPVLAFVATFAFWVSVWVSNAAVAVTAATATARVVPALGDDTRIALTAIAFLVVLTVNAAFGARSTGRLAILTVMIKVVPLFAVLVIVAQLGGPGEAPARLAAMPVTIDNIAAATALTLFALLGFETAVAPVDKVREPRRTIPLALVGGTAFVALIYLASTTAITAVIPADQLAQSTSPFADAMGIGWGTAGALLAVACIAVSGFGYINGGVMIAGELAYSMALRGELPRVLTRTGRDNAPVVAQVVGTALTIALIVANMAKTSAALFAFMALLTTSATLWLYLLAALAALKLRPGAAAALLVVGGLLFTLFAFYGSGWEANAWSVALLGAGLLVYAAMKLSSSASTIPARAAAPAEPPGS